MGRNQNLPTKQVRQCKVNCFSEGTLVAAEGGPEAIERLNAGDRVWAFDETSGEIELRQVLQLFTRQRDEIYVLTLGEESIRTTDEHPFFVEGRGWVEAHDLEIGDLVRTKSGEAVRLDKIEVEEGTEQVFNFSVEGLSTYFVGDREVLVHNCGPVPSRTEDSLRSRMRDAGLQGLPGGFGSRQTGPFRYRPPKGHNPANQLPIGPKGGYMERFDNEWVQGPAHGLAGHRGFAKEWDVQLSAQGQRKWGKYSVDAVGGGKYLNVTRTDVCLIQGREMTKILGATQ